MVLDLPRTAITITDPQIDFLSPNGVTWGLVGNTVAANKTVEHKERNGFYLDVRQQELSSSSPKNGCLKTQG
jgi:hypothetical protein